MRSIPGVTWRTRLERKNYSLAAFLEESHGRFAVILISRPHNMSAFNIARSQIATTARKAVVIYDAEAIFAQRDIRRKAISGEPLSAAAGKALIDSEIDLAKAVDVVLAVNDKNASLFRSAGHADVRVVRHAVFDRFGAAPHAWRETILFVGPTYSDETPNTDSVVWFVDNVLPLLRQKQDSPRRLTVVGRSTAPAIAAMSREVVDLRGPLQDLDGEYSRALLFVAPTRFAAGIPLKVYEAAAHGVPCVVTPLLAEQLEWRHEEEVLVAGTPELFAQQCLRLMQDDVVWEKLRVAAYRRTLRECDWSLFKSTVREILPLAPLPQSSARRPQHRSDA